MMKKSLKLLVVVFAAALLLCAFAVASSAATSVKLDAVGVTRNTADVTISCEASYLTSAQIYLSYDTSVLTYTGCTVATGSEEDYCSAVVQPDGRLLINFYAASHAYMKDMVKVHFSIDEDARGATDITAAMKNVFICPDNTGLNSRAASADEVQFTNAKLTIPTVKELRITSSKLFYELGEVEELDPSTFDISAIFSTGDYLTVSPSDCVINDGGFNGNVGGFYTISITYREKTNTISILVAEVPEKIEITELPDTLTYKKNSVEELDLTGLKVIATYSDGAEIELLPAELNVTGFDPATVGEQTITVAYFDLQATFEVEVVDTPTRMKGDVDGDNRITASDARLALRASVNLENLTEEQAYAADVDRDNKISASDARLILRGSVGLEDITKW